MLNYALLNCIYVYKYTYGNKYICSPCDKPPLVSVCISKTDFLICTFDPKGNKTIMPINTTLP